MKGAESLRIQQNQSVLASKSENAEFLVRSAFRVGSLDLEQKSSADEREAYKGTTSEDVAIEKEQKKKKFGEFQP